MRLNSAPFAKLKSCSYGLPNGCQATTFSWRTTLFACGLDVCPLSEGHPKIGQDRSPSWRYRQQFHHLAPCRRTAQMLQRIAPKHAEFNHSFGDMFKKRFRRWMSQVSQPWSSPLPNRSSRYTPSQDRGNECKTLGKSTFGVCPQKTPSLNRP